MFLRKNRKRFEGEIYEYWTLCQTVRTEGGPRQRVVATLGKFTEEDLSAGWGDLEALLEGRPPAPKQRELFGAPTGGEDPGRRELADLQSLGAERVREFGSVFLALASLRQMQEITRFADAQKLGDVGITHGGRSRKHTTCRNARNNAR